MTQPHPQRLGITRVEVILMISILVLVIGLAVPAVHLMKAEAARTTTINYLTFLGKATHNFAGTYGTKLPYNGTPTTGIRLNDRSVSIFAHLVPFVEQDCCVRTAPDSTVIPPFTTPQDFTARQTGLTSNGLGLVSFAGNAQLFNSGTIQRLPAGFAPAGTSNVVMYGTAWAVCGNTERAWSSLSAFELPPPDSLVTGTITCYQSSNAAYRGEVEPLIPNVLVPLPQPRNTDPTDCVDSRLQSFGSVTHVCMGDGSVRGVSSSVTIYTWSVVNSPKRGPEPNFNPCCE